MQMKSDAIQGRELHTLSSAWVVTWKYFSDEEREEDYVCLFDARTRPDYVLRRIEQLYVNFRLPYSRQLAYADDRESLPLHERAQYVQGVYKGEIWCGLHPTLYARKVENVRVIQDRTGQEHLLWDDIDHAAARPERSEQASDESQSEA